MHSTPRKPSKSRNRRNGQKHHGQNDHRQKQHDSRPHRGQKQHHGENRPVQAGTGAPGAAPRPIASTQPIGGDFANVTFMQTR